MKHTTFALLLFLLLLIGCKENTLELYDEEFIPEEIAYLHVIKNVDLQRSSTLKATFKGEPDPDYRVAKSVKGECCTYDPYRGVRGRICDRLYRKLYKSLHTRPGRRAKGGRLRDG